MAAFLIALAIGTMGRVVGAIGEYEGRITFAGLPVPGATITATQGQETVVASSDQNGIYQLSGLGDGVWNVRVEMLGFETLKRDISIADTPVSIAWEMKLMAFDEIRNIATISSATAGATKVVLDNRPTSGISDSQTANGSSTRVETPVAESPNALDQQAAEGFLINGSVNNGAASPFAQTRAFGNDRSSGSSLYTGSAGFNFGNSALDARPFSFTANPASRPDYSDFLGTATFGGPLNIPGVVNRPNLFVGYQRRVDTQANTQTALVPTADERNGVFPRQIVDPLTGQPFSANTIPSSRISPQARALLALYPEPNVEGARHNFQRTVLVATHQDDGQSRWSHTLSNRNALNGTLTYQRIRTISTNLFGFTDRTVASSTDVATSWSHRFSPFLSVRVGHQLTRRTNDVTPFFAGRANVSGDAGITGNNQSAGNWGPPGLIFSGGVVGLKDGQASSGRDLTHAGTVEVSWRTRGRQTVTFGAGSSVRRIHAVSQSDPRGTFGFTGSTTGTDVADFLLGLPHTASMAIGNADKQLRGTLANAYLADDWRLNPALTLNLGARWEYESPLTERNGRLANLSVGPGFSSATPVIGARLHRDLTGVQPRLAVAWRPLAGSSLVVRAGYGMYRDTNVYQAIALLMAEQPPVSRAFTVESTAARRLTLADGLASPPSAAAGTFAVDPNFRVSDAHNWQVAVQRDLPASLTITATYLGTKGRHLMQESVPNSYPAGAANPCASCPIGFVYLTSSGHSLKNAIQLQLRRRLRGGFSAVTQYTLSKATDDAAAFTTAALNGSSIAQDWRNLDAEYARSSFDQRHLLSAQADYAGHGLLQSWTFTGQLSLGSGLPLTPVYLVPVEGTGILGTLRPDVAGKGFATPAPGTWGNAARNAITGPRQFSFNAGAARTFQVTNRFTLEWRVDATNVLNRVTYTALDTVFGSPQFGLPTRANPMRKVQSSLRMRW